METLVWMFMVAALLVLGVLTGRRSVWMGGGLVLFGIALAIFILAAPDSWSGQSVPAMPK